MEMTMYDALNMSRKTLGRSISRSRLSAKIMKFIFFKYCILY